MDKPLQALDEIQQFLALHDIQHVVIGGIADAIWGRPRVTLDADLKVLAGQRSIYEGVTFPVCTAEDLIIHKAISERDKDWLDVDGILDKRGKRLDQDYIMLWLEQFAEALERPQIIQRYRSLLLAKKLA